MIFLLVKIVVDFDILTSNLWKEWIRMNGFKDLGATMAAGAAVGYKMGTELRDMMNNNAAQQVIREWQTHAECLKNELQETRLQLANARSRIKICRNRL